MTKPLYAVVFISIAVLLSSCGKPGNNRPTLRDAGDLAAIKERKELVVLTRNSPTNWYIDRDGRAAGPEHDFVVAFAKSLGVTARFIVADSVQDMLNSLAKGQADLVAGSITHTQEREEHFLFGPDYGGVIQQVVCNNQNKPKKLADLAKLEHLVVPANTSYASQLALLAQQNPELELRWQEIDNISTEQLFAKVASYTYDCTIADSNLVAINRRYYPDLLVMFNLSKQQMFAWPMPKGSEQLKQAAEEWLIQYQNSGKYTALIERYYGFLTKWDYVDKSTLIQRIDTVYPQFDPYFTKAAMLHGFDKWLLAAQAYQESHWNPAAVSFTGVRGIMMLTLPTAKALGVENRLDPEQSIMGGAAYLRQIIESLHEDIPAPDRYYFALAAYNIGLYHLRDAMTLAKKKGKNPHKWADVKKTLPLLMQREYYLQLPYGYARGTEAVNYVSRIRDYSDIIRRSWDDSF